MADLEERIRELQNQLDDATQDLGRKKRQIQLLKRTNKILEDHAKKKSSVHVEDDSPRTHQLEQEIQRLRQKLTNQEQNNIKLGKIVSDQSDKIKQYEEELAQHQILHIQLEKSKSQRTKQSENKITEYQKKIFALQNQLTKTKKSISQLKSVKANNIKSTNRQEQNAGYLQQSLTSTNRVQFFQPVHLTQSLNQNHLQIPTTHKKLFKLLDIYYQRLMVFKEKVKFLNLLSAHAENSLQAMSEQFQLQAIAEDE